MIATNARMNFKNQHDVNRMNGLRSTNNTEKSVLHK